MRSRAAGLGFVRPPSGRTSSAGGSQRRLAVSREPWWKIRSRTSSPSRRSCCARHANHSVQRSPAPFRRPRRPPIRDRSLRASTSAWCGRPDSNRHRPFGPTDFRTRYGFRRRRSAFVVWTIPSPWRVRALGAARLVSTPSAGHVGPGLGSGLPVGEVSPNLGSSAAPVSRGALNCSSPLRLPVSPRPHLAANLTTAQDRAKPKSTMRRRR